MGFKNLISPMENYKFPKMAHKLVPPITLRRLHKNENPMDVRTQRRELYKLMPLQLKIRRATFPPQTLSNRSELVGWK